MTERDPDRDDEAQARDVGQGYPEESPPGTDTGAHAQERTDTDTGDRPDADDAPDTSTDEDREPSKATGNPKAAGG